MCGFEARTPARASAERAAPQIGAEQSDRESQDYINHLEQQLEEANARILEAASQLQVREQQAERLEATLAAKENDALALRALLKKVSVEGKECVGASEAQSLQAELMHARWAMLGVAGMAAPEILGNPFVDGPLPNCWE
ncbi:MAG: chlorophyll a/b-binding protein, partial [Promethearchaeia archaeon]